MTPSGPKFERRCERRVRLAIGSACRLVAPPDFRCRPAIIWDVSPSGIGLVLTEPLPVGTTLLVRPGGLSRPDDVVGMSVRHVRRLGEGRWLVGCSHARDVAAGELRALLDALRAPR